MIKDGKMTGEQLKKALSESDQVPEILVHLFLCGKNETNNKNFKAENYMYTYSVRFVEKALTEQQYLRFIGEEVYNKKVVDLTNEQIELAKNTIYFIEKNYETYIKTLIQYITYIELNQEKIITEFIEDNAEQKYENIKIIFDVLVMNNFCDTKINTYFNNEKVR